ncbi:FecR domain-containing protein [Planctomycetota bacterium]
MNPSNKKENIQDLLIRLLEDDLGDDQLAELLTWSRNDSDAVREYCEFLRDYAVISRTIEGQVEPEFGTSQDTAFDRAIWDALRNEEETTPSFPMKNEPSAPDQNRFSTSDSVNKDLLEDGVTNFSSAIFDDPMDDSAVWQALLEAECTAPGIERIIESPEVPEKPPAKAPAKPVRISKFWPVTALVSSAALIVLLLYAQLSAWLLPREVATLTSSIKAEWDMADTTIGLGQRLQTKKPMRLTKGLAELVFDEGAKVVVEAPAVFKLYSENRMLLQSGRVTALVSEAAQGFRVDTPTSQVTDLGTEFGVQVSQYEGVMVQMYQGQARLALKSARKKHVLIQKGQARQVNAGGTSITEIPFEKRVFVTAHEFVAMRDRPLVQSPTGMVRHPGLCVHLDASRVSTLTVGDGANVSVWRDISTGSSYHATLQGGTATYVPDALGPGLGAVDFGNPDLVSDEVSTQMRLMTQHDSKIFLDQSEASASGFTVALVVRAQSLTTNNRCDLIGNTDMNKLPGFFVRWHVAEGQPKAAASLAGETLRQNCVFIDKTVVLICCYDRKNQTLSLWNSNSGETSRRTVEPGDYTTWKDGDSAADFNEDLYLGAIGPNHYKRRYFDGLIGEVRIYTQALEVEDMMTLKDELVKKWGVNVSAF